MNLDKVTFCGVRDLDEGQFRKLAQSPARVVYGNCNGDIDRMDFTSRLDEELTRTAGESKPDCLFHVDLDCLDISLGRVNGYAATGGLYGYDLEQCLCRKKKADCSYDCFVQPKSGW